MGRPGMTDRACPWVAAVVFAAIVFTAESTDGADLKGVATLDSVHVVPTARGRVEGSLGEANVDAKDAALTKQANFLKLIERAGGSYCSGSKAQSVFCHLMRGLRRKYFLYLKNNDPELFRSYVLRLNIRYCT